MRRIVRTARTMMLYLATLLLVGAYPMMTVAAEEVPATSSTSTATTLPVKPKTTYTYDEATGRWNTNSWVYNAATGQYEPVVTVQPTVADSPPTATIITPPASTEGATPAVEDATKQGNDTTTSTELGADTSVDAAAKTGDASVTKNTSAESATSGDASSTATIVNTVNSLIQTGDNQKAATFVADITGDVTGDIVLQPMLLKAMLEANAPAGSVTATANNQLTNNVNLSAQSGDATVSANTKAGDATTGTANTVADVVNIINSMVAANQSFIGTINIYGNLNGDILIAPDFIPQLIASNGGVTGANTAQVVNATDTQSIINNVSLAAASGQAAVLGNTTAGSAKTGDANTNLVIFNLSGHEIVAHNSLLVFVNVLGTWVGVIVDAPVGTTAAAIGSGVTTNTAVRPDLIVSTDTSNQITNNINLLSQSGDALVTGNTSAGNATSGNATASANIANISNSQIGLTGWFGILYINVYGGWLGSFGIDTPYGSVPVRAVTEVGPRPVEFVARGTLGTPMRIAPQPITVIAPDTGGSYKPTTMQPEPATLASARVATSPRTGGTMTLARVAQRSDYRLPIVIGSMVLMGMSAIGFRRLSA